MVITKRDGRVQKYDSGKIKKAITKAILATVGEMDSYYEDKTNKIIDYIEKKLKSGEIKPEVEAIQDAVYQGLCNIKNKKIAQNFAIYREDRARQRLNKSNFMKTVKEKLDASNVQNQNANVDEKSFGGRQGEVVDSILKQYALDNCMSKMSKNNHINNEIYIHDLSHYALGDHNCLSIPFDLLLKNGFKTRQCDIRSANSINTAMQLIAVIFQCQSLVQFGGVSATHLDYTIAPYVKKSFYKHYMEMIDFLTEEGELISDNEYRQLKSYFNNELSIESNIYKQIYNVYEYAMKQTQKEMKQAAEGLFHNLNSLQSRSGNQLPFTSICYGTDTSPEGRMVIKALLEASLDGIGALHKTPIFPCSIFKLKKGVNRKPGEPNYDLYQLALKSTSRRLYPNYVNCDWSVNKGYDEKDPKQEVAVMG